MKDSIHTFDDQLHRAQVVEVWRRVFGYEAAHNEPHLAIDKKLVANDGLFFVAQTDGKVVGTIMAGYDGHRGWIYSLAVLPEHRKKGIGSRLMRHAEERLEALGCAKINLQITQGNEAVAAFYHRLGYETEPRISMGKRLVGNVAVAKSEALPTAASAVQD